MRKAWLGTRLFIFFLYHQYSTFLSDHVSVRTIASKASWEPATLGNIQMVLRQNKGLKLSLKASPIKPEDKEDRVAYI